MKTALQAVAPVLPRRRAPAPLAPETIITANVGVAAGSLAAALAAASIAGYGDRLRLRLLDALNAVELVTREL